MRPGREIIFLKKKKKMARQARKTAFSMTAFFLFIISGSLFLSWLSGVEQVVINDISVEGNNAVSQEEIVSAVNESMEGRYFKLFSKKNFLIYPKKETERQILDKHKRIKNLDIQRDSRNSLVIKVEERKSAFLWCKLVFDEKYESEKEHCYFMDNRGVVFSRAPHFSGNIFFKFFGDLENGIKDIIGNRFVGENEFLDILVLKKGFENFKLETIKFTKSPDGEYNLFIKKNVADGFWGGARIIFDEGQSAGDILGNFGSVVGLIDIEKKLDYIDLRFGHKVFYKFKEI